MANENDSAKIEIVLRCERAKLIDGTPDVEISTRPSATSLTNAAILDIPRRNTVSFQCIGHCCKAASCRMRLEASTVN